MVIGERRQRDVGPGDREDRDREQPVHARESRVVGYIACGKAIRIAMPMRRADRGDQQRVGDDAGLRLLRVGEQLGEPAPQPQRRELRGELDDQHRIGEAAERGRAIDPAGDEQERQPRREPQRRSRRC